MRTNAQVDIGAPQPYQLRGAQLRLDREREQAVIATAGPTSPVRSREECIDLRLRQEGDEASLEAFRGNGEHALDQLGLLRMAKGGIAKQGANRGEPGVAGADTISSVMFTLVEERTGERDRKRDVCSSELEPRGVHRSPAPSGR